MLLPAEPSDGYLWVAVADVTGNLFNLLPNLGRPDAAVAELGAVERRDPAASASPTASPRRRPTERGRPSPSTTTFGKSLIIVFRTDRPLFDTLRPTTEIVASFAEDLGRDPAGRAGPDPFDRDAGHRIRADEAGAARPSAANLRESAAFVPMHAGLFA